MHTTARAGRCEYEQIRRQIQQADVVHVPLTQVVLRKLIGTLRNDRGMFVHETLLSLLATCRQQGRNPYEEFKRIARNNEMISRAQAVPAVACSG